MYVMTCTHTPYVINMRNNANTTIVIIKQRPGIVAHTFNPSTRRQRQTDLHDFRASLVHIVNSRLPGLCRETKNEKTKLKKNKY